MAWIRGLLGWSLELVQKPSHRGWYPEGVEPPPLPAFTLLKRRWLVKRTSA